MKASKELNFSSPLEGATDELFVAVQTGDTEKALAALAVGADVNTRNRFGKTPLHYARSSRLIHLLIERGARPNIQDANGRAALHFIAVERDRSGFEDARYLISRGADPFLTDNDLLTPIEMFCDEYRATPLHWWAAIGEQSQIELCLQLHIDINAPDIDMWTPLHYAAAHGTVNTVRLLASKGAKCNMTDICEMNPLTAAACYAHTETLRTLAELGADVNHPLMGDRNPGFTPLHFAALHGLADMTEILLNHGAKVNTADLMGQTPLHVATRYNQEAVVALLLSHGADPAVKDHEAYAPLYHALRNKNKKIVEDLIRAGAPTDDPLLDLPIIAKSLGLSSLSTLMPRRKSTDTPKN